MASLRNWGTLRIAALPLTRAPPIAYYNFKVIPPPAPPNPPPTSPPSVFTRWLPEEGVVKWAAFKVDKTWTGFGKAQKGNWRLRVFELGERFLDKLDFEESALKSLDIANGPPAKVPSELTGQELADAEAAWRELTVPLLYPPAVSSSASALNDLRALIAKRIPLHQRGFITYSIIAPFTAPFMIVPVIPNLPFFFCAWRAWSHYQALRAARRIDALLRANKIVPEALPALDEVYTSAPPSTNAPLDSGDTSPNESASNLLTTAAALAPAARALDLAPNEVNDMTRAYEQARVRIKKTEQQKGKEG
ncbi:mitochondrial K+-H+ exchange-related-domain-containing protein [Mycena rebaudengoi]|nr:mitochondrial K+-H+ exchange-related-domain-containing protein [Mycena rebaudengoi]